MFWTIYITRNISTSVKSLPISKILQLRPHNQYIKLMGWLKSYRRYKERSFLHVDDGSTFQRLQVIVPKSICPSNLTYHSCVCIEGNLVESSGKMQNMDLVAEKIMVVSQGAPIEYPFTEKATYLQEDLRTSPHFRPRTRRFAAALRVRAQVKKSIQTYFEQENFLPIDTPIFTTNDCEGGSDVFFIKNKQGMESEHGQPAIRGETFAHPVFLTVSGQLHLEAITSGFSRVYNFNPAFRGEKGSRFHLHEFWMVEMEEAFLEGRNGYQALSDRLENLFKFTLKDVVERSLSDLHFLWETNQKKEILQKLIPALIERPFIKMKFKEALQILLTNKERLDTAVTPTDVNLSRDSELFLTKFCGDAAVLITDWPVNSKPFYMYSENSCDGDVALGMDLLAPFVGEIAGGGLREYRYDVLEKNIAGAGAAENLRWYLELRKFGYAPSGGFGFGFERFLQLLLGFDNIRDTIPFPRGNGQCYC